MGLISKFKGLFNKNVECGSEIDDELVYLYPAKNGFNVGTNIVVKDGFIACFVIGNKIMDVVFSGKYKMNGLMLPNTFKKLKMLVANKKGETPTKFKCDLYFINVREFVDFEYESSIPFIFKTEEVGKVKGKLQGKCNFKIYDAETFLKYFISEHSRIKNDDVLEELSLIVGDEAVKIIEKSELGFFALLNNASSIYDVLNRSMPDCVSNLGISTKNVQVTSITLKNRCEKKIQDYLQEQNKPKAPNSEVIKEFSLSDDNVIAEKVNSVTDSFNDNIEMESVSINVNEINQNSLENNGSIKPLNVENEEMNSPSEKPLNENMSKVCPNCGNVIDVEYEYCPKCGHKQN